MPVSHVVGAPPLQTDLDHLGLIFTMIGSGDDPEECAVRVQGMLLVVPMQNEEA